MKGRDQWNPWDPNAVHPMGQHVFAATEEWRWHPPGSPADRHLRLATRLDDAAEALRRFGS